MSDIVEANEPTEEEIFFKQIRDKYRITPERFELGKEFAFAISEGTLSAARAYEAVFDVDFETAKKKASKMKHGKWIQELIRYFQFDESIEYNKETKDAVKVLHTIMMDPTASNRERTDASKALREYIKAEQLQQAKAEETVVNQTLNMIGDLVKGISQLSEQGKMVSASGVIIDVPILD